MYFVCVQSGRATNHHAMMAVGHVWFGCVIFLCDRGVVGIRVRQKRGLLDFGCGGGHVLCTVTSDRAANPHLDALFGMTWFCGKFSWGRRILGYVGSIVVGWCV